MTDAEEFDINPFIKRVRDGENLESIKRELFLSLCIKRHYKKECDPGYCVFRLIEMCPWIKAIRALKKS